MKRPVSLLCAWVACGCVLNPHGEDPGTNDSNSPGPFAKGPDVFEPSPGFTSPDDDIISGEESPVAPGPDTSHPTGSDGRPADFPGPGFEPAPLGPISDPEPGPLPTPGENTPPFIDVNPTPALPGAVTPTPFPQATPGPLAPSIDEEESEDGTEFDGGVLNYSLNPKDGGLAEDPATVDAGDEDDAEWAAEL